MTQPSVTCRLALATARAIGRERAFWLVLMLIAALIPAAAELALFAMGSRATLVREMGLASLVLGSLAIALSAGHYQPGGDLRSGTGAQILATPLCRTSYVAGRLLGLGLSLVLATTLWLATLAGTLARHDAGVLDAGMLGAAASVLAGTLALGAVLQRASLALAAAPTAAFGIGLYVTGQLAGLLHAHASATVGTWASAPLRIVPALSSLNLIEPAARGWPIPAGVVALAVAHATLASAAFAVWTADSIARRGAAHR